MQSKVVNRRAYGDLFKNLLWKENKLRYMGSWLGYLWSLLPPIALVISFYFVFKYILRVQDPTFLPHLVIGTIHWTLFVQIISQSAEVLTGNAGLIQKVYFPRILLNLAMIVTNLRFWLIGFAVVVIFLPLLNGQISTAMIAYPAIFILFMMMLTGFSLFISALNIVFKDIKYLLEVIFQLWFWMTPIVYKVEQVPQEYRSFFMLNPVTPYIIAAQDIFVKGQFPSISIWIPCIAIAVIFLLGGWYFYQKQVPHLVDRL